MPAKLFLILAGNTWKIIFVEILEKIFMISLFKLAIFLTVSVSILGLKAPMI
jgi:hypothetical protein